MGNNLNFLDAALIMVGLKSPVANTRRIDQQTTEEKDRTTTVTNIFDDNGRISQVVTQIDEGKDGTIDSSSVRDYRYTSDNLLASDQYMEDRDNDGTIDYQNNAVYIEENENKKNYNRTLTETDEFSKTQYINTFDDNNRVQSRSQSISAFAKDGSQVMDYQKETIYSYTKDGRLASRSELLDANNDKYFDSVATEKYLEEEYYGE